MQKVSIIDVWLVSKYTSDYLLALVALEGAHFPLISFLHTQQSVQRKEGRGVLFFTNALLKGNFTKMINLHLEYFLDKKNTRNSEQPCLSVLQSFTNSMGSALSPSASGLCLANWGVCMLSPLFVIPVTLLSMFFHAQPAAFGIFSWWPHCLVPRASRWVVWWWGGRGPVPADIHSICQRHLTSKSAIIHKISEIVPQLVGQLVYFMFIINNRTSFHLWWKGNWLKHQRVSKYYENDCSYHLPFGLM